MKSRSDGTVSVQASMGCMLIVARECATETAMVLPYYDAKCLFAWLKKIESGTVTMRGPRGCLEFRVVCEKTTKAQHVAYYLTCDNTGVTGRTSMREFASFVRRAEKLLPLVVEQHNTLIRCIDDWAKEWDHDSTAK